MMNASDNNSLLLTECEGRTEAYWLEAVAAL